MGIYGDLYDVCHACTSLLPRYLTFSSNTFSAHKDTGSVDLLSAPSRLGDNALLISSNASIER